MEFGQHPSIKEKIKSINLTKSEWNYIAGFIEADGSIFISKCKRGTGYTSIIPTLDISNTDIRVLKWFKEKFKRGSFIRDNRKLRGNEKVRYAYIINGFAILPILKGIYPYLKIKFVQAELIIKYLNLRLKQDRKETYSIEQNNIVEIVGKLNKRGIN